MTIRLKRINGLIIVLLSFALGGILIGLASTGYAAHMRRGAGTLADLMSAVAQGRVGVVELGGTLKEHTPVIQLPPPFANTPGFKKHLISAYDENGPAWKWYWYEDHSIMHGAGKYGITSLFNLDALPETGAVLIVLPMKVEDGTGSPVRPIALVLRR